MSVATASRRLRALRPTQKAFAAETKRVFRDLAASKDTIPRKAFAELLGFLGADVPQAITARVIAKLLPRSDDVDAAQFTRGVSAMLLLEGMRCWGCYY